MKRLYLISATTLCLTAVVVGTALWTTRPNSSETADQRQSEPSLDVTDSPVRADTNTPSLTPEQQQLLENPETLSFTRQLEFQADVRQFFQQADSLTVTERHNQAADLRQRLEEYEAADKVSAPEGLMVRIAMVKLEVQGEEAQKQAVSELINQYQAESQARHQAWLNRPKPQFEAYKEQEKQIVAEVMAMDRIPNGMDRNEYLRQRLLQARVAAESQSQ